MSDVLTISKLGDLVTLDRGIQTGAKLKFYPFGSDSADNPWTGRLRCYAHEGGGFWPNDADVRDAFVHVSGMFERWFSVRELMDAISNLDGHLGLDKPIATIEFD